MKISELCVQRPVFATVLSLAVVLVGLVSYDRLTVREYPKIDPPVVNVETSYSGASPEIIETQVTQVLEEQLAGIEGVDFMTSISRQEQSQITVTFQLSRDPGEAAADYAAMAKLIPLLAHLDAPNGPHRIVIDRFSPLYRGHDANGIGAVTPVPG